MIEGKGQQVNLNSASQQTLVLSQGYLQAEIVDSEEDLVNRSKYHESSEETGTRVIAGVSRAEGSKCDRCWNYSSHVGSDKSHPSLCERCVPVINEIGFQLPPTDAVAA